MDKTFLPLPSKEEVIREARFNHPELHQCYLKTRWAMRNILGHYLDTSPADVQLRNTKLGKPELMPSAGSLDIRFNLSHCSDAALLAVTLGSEVGIDMEKEGQKLRSLRLAKRYFTKNTVKQLAALPEAEQQTALLKLWTQYEAYKKAQGIGLRGGEGLLPLSIEVKTNQLQTFPTDTGKASNWLVCQLNPAKGYIAAVVIEAPSTEMKIQHIKYNADLFTKL
jgi:4'-phosphopantetheinyl transferase